MKKLFLIMLALAILSVPFTAYADTKESALPAVTSVAPTDFVRVVTDPTGSPANKDIQAARLTAAGVTGTAAPTVLNQGYYKTSYAGTTTFTLPVISATPTSAQVPPGWQGCFGGYTTNAQVVKVDMPASHVLYYKGVGSTAGASHGYGSGGAAGDLLCVWAAAVNVYEALGAGYGTWTAY